MENTIITENRIETSIVESYINTNILGVADLKSLDISKEFMVDTFLSVPMYRTLPVKLFGVLNSQEFATPESKLWQCKIEAEVHSNELIRDLHELELKRIKIDKFEYLINNVMEPKFLTETDPVKKKEIEYDIREQKVYLSLSKFESMQLQKRIKYRIQEVSEWKDIAKHLIDAGVKPENYTKTIVFAMKRKWESELADNSISEEDKKVITGKLQVLNNQIKLSPVE